MADDVTRQGPVEHTTSGGDASAGVAKPDPVAAVSAAAGDGELSDADLDRVSGGANDVRPPVRTVLSRSQ